MHSNNMTGWFSGYSSRRYDEKSLIWLTANFRCDKIRIMYLPKISSKLNQRGIASLVVILVLLLGIGAGLALIGSRVSFNSRAQAQTPSLPDFEKQAGEVGNAFRQEQQDIVDRELESNTSREENPGFFSDIRKKFADTVCKIVNTCNQSTPGSTGGTSPAAVAASTPGLKIKDVDCTKDAGAGGLCYNYVAGQYVGCNAEEGNTAACDELKAVCAGNAAGFCEAVKKQVEPLVKKQKDAQTAYITANNQYTTKRSELDKAGFAVSQAFNKVAVGDRNDPKGNYEYIEYRADFQEYWYYGKDASGKIIPEPVAKKKVSDQDYLDFYNSQCNQNGAAACTEYKNAVDKYNAIEKDLNALKVTKNTAYVNLVKAQTSTQAIRNPEEVPQEVKDAIFGYRAAGFGQDVLAQVQSRQLPFGAFGQSNPVDCSQFPAESKRLCDTSEAAANACRHLSGDAFSECRLEKAKKLDPTLTELPGPKTGTSVPAVIAGFGGAKK